MADYNISLLTPNDFEDLSRDLIQRECHLHLECFTAGRDGGIDFRYIGTEGSKTIVQCKHYAKSDYSKLISDLEKKELGKVQILKPDRYILVTSLGLTPMRKDEIKSIFEPYIKETKDIFGFDDLNNLLRKYEDIAKKNYKLWFTSVDVLNRIIHSEVYTQSELEIQNLSESVKIFVKNSAFHQVKKILSKNNFCIIIGNPGIGKTTIAQYILSEYLERGYSIISIKEIDQAYKLFNSNQKQFFYYDDFLGRSIYGEKLTKNEDDKIITLIESIKKSKHTKFLLTTRSYLLNQAQIEYEKLNSPTIFYGKYSVELSDYSIFERAKILYNHIWYSTLPDHCVNEIITDRKYYRIINHRNFTPRLVKAMMMVPTDSKKSYSENFFNNLENPEGVWEHAFIHQISESSRNLLLILNTLAEEIDIDRLKEAFLSFNKAQSQKYQFKCSANDFNISLKELDGSFVITLVKKYQKERFVRFENPSIHDFINHYLMKNPELIIDIFHSTAFFEQNIILQNLIDGLRSQYNYGSDRFLESFMDSAIRTFYVNLPKKGQSSTLSHFTFEKRLYVLTKFTDKLKDESFTNFVSVLFEKLILNINEDNVSSKDLIALFDSLGEQESTRNYHLDYNALLSAIKTWFLRTAENIDDFVQFSEVSKKHNINLNEEEFEIIRDRFAEEFLSGVSMTIDPKTQEEHKTYWYKSQIEDQLNSGDVECVEDFVYKLEKCSDFFNVDLSEEIDDLRRNIDHEDHDELNDDNYEEFKLNELSQKQSHQDIDQLFLELENR